MLIPIIDLRRASRLDIWSWFHTLYLSFFRKSKKSFSVLSALDTQVIASDNFSLAIVSITNSHREILGKIINQWTLTYLAASGYCVRFSLSSSEGLILNLKEQKKCLQQCCESVTFWYGSGSAPLTYGSVSCFFVSGWQDVKKLLVFSKVFFTINY